MTTVKAPRRMRTVENKIKVEQMNIYMDKLYNVVSAPTSDKVIDNIIDFVEEQKKKYSSICRKNRN